MPMAGGSHLTAIIYQVMKDHEIKCGFFKWQRSNSALDQVTVGKFSSADPDNLRGLDRFQRQISGSAMFQYQYSLWPAPGQQGLQ